jgi:hypothetical protein
MTAYSLRLYKKVHPEGGRYQLVQQVPIEAGSEAEAIEKARVAKIFPADNSDAAMLFAEDGHSFWRLEFGDV